jgi:tRNA pseudouridine38-40 synthase
MRTLVLLLQYDGTDFAGWQKQVNDRTIQEEIEIAFSKVIGKEVILTGAGRTDAGVHARGQVANLIIPEGFPIPESKIAIAINTLLPKDIRIQNVKILNINFNSRFDAISREYSYTIAAGQSVFLSRFITCVKFNYDFKLLQECAKIFKGNHDFTTFSKNNTSTSNYTCTVEKCLWDEVEHEQARSMEISRLSIKADRFVYGMVRALVGAMLDVARGKRQIDDLKSALESRDRQQASTIAPPHGLILENVYYPERFGLIWS